MNTYTTSYQDRSSVAVFADGDFFILSVSFGSAGNDWYGSSIQHQPYHSGASAHVA